MNHPRLHCVGGLLVFATVFMLLGCSQTDQKNAVNQQGLLTSSSGYQAVVLTSGQVYFGKLEGLDTAHPILREVFYVQGAQDPETKKIKYVLIKRGREAHSPDRMILNPQHIVLIEPVSQESKVAELIAQSKHSDAALPMPTSVRTD